MEEQTSTELRNIENTGAIEWKSDPESRLNWMTMKWDNDAKCWRLTVNTNLATLAHVQHNDGEMILKFEAVK